MLALSYSLAEQNPDWFGVAITTVDGQQLHFGDSDLEFSIQSCVKPLTYCLAVEEAGLRKTHRHIGIEPSGLAFNEVSLNADSKYAVTHTKHPIYATDLDFLLHKID